MKLYPLDNAFLLVKRQNTELNLDILQSGILLYNTFNFLLVTEPDIPRALGQNLFIWRYIHNIVTYWPHLGSRAHNSLSSNYQTTLSYYQKLNVKSKNRCCVILFWVMHLLINSAEKTNYGSLSVYNIFCFHLSVSYYPVIMTFMLQRSGVHVLVRSHIMDAHLPSHAGIHPASVLCRVSV